MPQCASAGGRNEGTRLRDWCESHSPLLIFSRLTRALFRTHTQEQDPSCAGGPQNELAPALQSWRTLRGITEWGDLEGTHGLCARASCLRYVICARRTHRRTHSRRILVRSAGPFNALRLLFNHGGHVAVARKRGRPRTNSGALRTAVLAVREMRADLYNL